MVNYSEAHMDAVFTALADATRRGMIARLSAGPATIGELGQPYGISKPAVTKHVKMLERAGLIRRKRDGRVHKCTLQSRPMMQAEDWIERQRRFWEASLDNLVDLVEQSKPGGSRMTTTTGIHLKFERSLDAPVEHVYKVLTARDYIARWYGPSDDFKVTVHQWDAQVGGTYRVEFNTPGGETHIVVGVFKELVPNEKVAYTWSWEGQPPMDTLVTFTICPEGQKTKLTLIHDGFPAEEVRAHHEQGWTGSLERLTRAVIRTDS